MLILWRILIFAAIWLIFECAMSWAAFCHQANGYGGEHQTTEKYNCIFKGPVASSMSSFLRLWMHVFDKPDAYVALFTGVLAIGTLALWWSTRKLWRVTDKTLRHSEDTARRQLRAYVGLEKLSFELTNENNPSFVLDLQTHGVTHEDFIAVKIRNFGPTPASDVCVFVYAAPTPPYQRLPDDFFLTRDNDRVSTGAIRITLARFLLQPNQMEITKTVVHPHLVRDARAGRINLYLYGRIYYRDIYSRPWRTRFCFLWEPGTASRAERFVAYEQYNGEDQVELA
jgi:hypothetical protein